MKMDENHTFVERIKFSDFCDVCDKVRQMKNKKCKTDVLKRYIDYLRTNVEGESIYPIMRLFLPHYDRDRGSYGLKEDRIGRIYVKVLDLAKTGKDAVSLLNYRMPTTFKFRQAVTDYAEVVYGVMKSRNTNDSELTIAEVNDALDTIARSFSEKNSEEKMDVFFDQIIGKMSAKEQKWLIRVILKSTHIGVSQKQILNLFHPDAFKFLSTSYSLLKLCSTLTDPFVRNHETNIKLFEAFRPMLSEKCNIEKMKLDGDYFVETKLDGERYQIHYSKGEYKYFSRNGFETSTFYYGNNVSTGYFTANLQPLFNSQYTSFILDGEMMAWHKLRKCPITQGNFRDVGKAKVGGDVQPCFFPFDILYCNEKLLTYTPLHERLELLNKVFTPKEGVLMQLNRIKVNSRDQVVDALNKAIESHEEGIIVKEINSIYKPNERITGAWYKIKPEYSDGALMELDVLIIGGCFGTGPLKGTVSRYLIGLVTSDDGNGTPTSFQSLTMVASGFTLEESDELRSKLNPYWISMKKLPSMLQFGKMKPDVYIEPKNSIILQVKASQIIWSDKFACGYSLRFPRVERVRYDKSWKDCMTITQFQEINKATSGMLTTGPLHAGKSHSGSLKRKHLETLPQFQKQDLKGLSKKSSIFQNKKICVVSGTNEHTKNEMEKLIFENGGVISTMPDSRTYCIIVGQSNVRVKNFISSKKHVVVNHSWALDSIFENQLLPWMPYYVLSMTQLCEKEMKERFDVFGDSYFDPATQKSVEYSLNCPEMVKRLSKKIPDDETSETSDLILEDSDWNSCLKTSTAFFAITQDCYENIQNPVNFREDICCFKFLAGNVSEKVDLKTDYIVVHKKYKPNMQKLYELKSQGSFSTVIVSSDWIQKTWEEKQLVDYADFVIHGKQITEFKN